MPFLDRHFLDVAMAVDPQEKMVDKSKGRIEKWMVRTRGRLIRGRGKEGTCDGGGGGLLSRGGRRGGGGALEQFRKQASLFLFRLTVRVSSSGTGRQGGRQRQVWQAVAQDTKAAGAARAAARASPVCRQESISVCRHSMTQDPALSTLPTHFNYPRPNTQNSHPATNPPPSQPLVFPPETSHPALATAAAACRCAKRLTPRRTRTCLPTCCGARRSSFRMGWATAGLTGSRHMPKAKSATR